MGKQYPYTHHFPQASEFLPSDENRNETGNGTMRAIQGKAESMAGQEVQEMVKRGVRWVSRVLNQNL